MNKLASEAKEFAIASKPLVAKAKENKIDIGVAPTYMSLATVRKFAAKKMIVAAQNVHFEDHGAFTGEVSIPMLKEFKIDWVILGHSERRTYDGETSEKCNKKMKALLANDMVPVYCCGETLEQFDAGETKAVVAEQIKKGFEGISEEDAKKVVVAYEPIWAIGTGKTATAEQAEEVCEAIRAVLRKEYGARPARAVSILYGGSMNAKNAAELLAQPDIDGGLIGGASLKPVDFATIVAATAQEA